MNMAELDGNPCSPLGAHRALPTFLFVKTVWGKASVEAFFKDVPDRKAEATGANDGMEEYEQQLRGF
jgi:hypothetical protein